MQERGLICLSMALENKYHQGDKFRIKISEKGQNSWQGVGHLDNGTMVVVDGAGDKVGKELDVCFMKFYQTSSGRMIFAEVSGLKKGCNLKRTTGRKRYETAAESLPLRNR